MKHHLKLLVAAACLAAAGLTANSARAATFGWSGSGTGAGSGANTAWLTIGNWTNNSGLPGSLDIALFGSAGSGTAIGFNFNGPPAGSTNIGALVLGVGSTVDRSLGNSSPTAGIATYMYYSGVGGGLISNLVSGRTLSLVPFNGGSLNAMTNILLASGNIHAVGAINIVGVLGEAGGARSITKSGIGALILNTNTFTGTLTVNQDGLVLLTGPGSMSGATLNTTSILRVAHSAALGTGNLTINPNNAETGRLELSNNVSVLSGRILTLSGRNNTTDAIRNISGNNTLAGSISITTGGSDYRIQSDSGTLTLSGGITSSATGARTVTLQGGASGSVPSVIQNGAATLSLAKGGAGAWTLTATNTYSGSTLISGGTLHLGPNASLSNSPLIALSGGPIFNVSSVPGGFNLMPNQTLSGSGLVLGPVTVAPGASVIPGGLFAAGTLTFSNTLTINSGNRINFDLASTPIVNTGSNDLMVVNGDLNFTVPVPITFAFPLGQPQLGVPYTLVRYSGALSGAGNLSIAGISSPAATLDTSVPGLITVTFAAAAANNIVWSGTNGFNFDLAATVNFTNDAGSAVQFNQGDTVLFDDSSTNQAVTLVGNHLQPATTTVNSSSNFTFSGSGSLAGGTLTKAGTGALNLNTVNAYAGQTFLNGGTLRLGAVGALGATNGPGFDAGTIIAAGATLDVNASVTDPINETITAQGAGVGGLGAIINSGAAGVNRGLRGTLTLLGDTTFSAANRWDMLNARVLGGGFKVTKLGASEMFMTGLGDTGFGDVDVLAGFFTWGGNSTPGDPTKIYTLGTGGILNFFNPTVPFNKMIIAQNGSEIRNGSGTANLVGPVSLIGAVTFNSTPPINVSNVVSGTGALLKSNTALLTLTGTNTYSGGTFVWGGQLQGNSDSLQGVITNNSAIIVNQNFDGTLAATVTSTGTGHFTKRGTGRLTVTTPMTITGVVTNEAGVLVLGADNVLGTGLLDWRGAGGLFPAFESADGTTRTLANSVSISTDTRLGAAGTGDLIFSGPINNGGAQKILTVSNANTTFPLGFNNLGVIVKSGPGQLTLGGPNNNAGLTISNGTVALALSGYFSNNPNVTIISGAVLDVSAGIGSVLNLGSGRTLVAGRTSGFADDIIGNVNSTGNVTIVAANIPGTLAVSGDFSQTGGTLSFDLANVNTVGGGVNDYISNPGVLNLSGSITIAVNLLNGALANGTYTLMEGAFGLASTATYTLTGTNGLRQTVAVNIGASTLELVVSGATPEPLAWRGTAGNNWDINTAINWSNMTTLALSTYFNSDSVLFDDTSPNTNVQITTTVSPSSVTVNASSNYTFAGAGLIAGGASISKSGSGTLAMGGANTYFGPVSVTGGTLRQSAAGALGNSTGVTINGGQFDFAGFAPSSRTLSYNISGSGPDGRGAIINSGNSVNASSLSNVTLAADASIGAVGTGGDFGRMDIGTGYGLLNGNGNKLTKSGPGFLAIRSSAIDLPEIIVAGGTLYTENIDNNVGAKVTVLAGARFGGTGARFYTNTVDLSAGSTFFTAVGNSFSTWAGPINVLGQSAFGATTVSAGAGAQDLRLVGSLNGSGNIVLSVAPLELTMNNDATYSGNITVNGTTLRLTTNGTHGTGVITNNGGTVDFNLPANLAYLRTIYGPSGTVTKNNTNVFQLAGAPGDQISDGQVFNLLGGVFDLNGRSEGLRGITGNAGTFLTNSGPPAMLTLTNPSANHSYVGNIVGPITLLVRNAVTHNTTLQTISADGQAAQVNTNSFTGGLIIDNGHLRAAYDMQLGAVPGSPDAANIILRNAGALQNFNSALDIHDHRGVLLDNGDGVFAAGFSRDIIVNGVISGGGRLAKGDGGRLILKNANTFTGDTVFTNWANVGAGILRIDHPLALQNSTFDATGLGANGALDLNSGDVMIGMLKGSGATISNFNGRLTVGGNGQNGVFGSVLFGAGQFVKVGGGTLVLSAANNPYHGGTIVNNGILVALGNLSGYGPVLVKSGATFGANGGVGGAVTVEPGGTLYPGASPGTLTISNHLAISSGSLFYELSSQNFAGLGLNDLIDVRSNLTLTGVSGVRFQFLNGSPAPGVPYTLLRYAGTLTGGASNFTAVASRYSATFDSSVAGEIRVTFNGAGSNLVWTGSSTNNTWNLDGFTNFFNGLALDTFKDGDHVQFDDSGFSASPVLLAGTLAPVSLVVSNETSDYTFAGPGALNLFNGFTKRGAARLTLANTNETIGRIDVLGGALALGADDHLGAPPLTASVRLALNGGELEATSSLALHPNRQIAVGPASGSGSGAIEVAAGQTLTLNGLVTNNFIGSGALVKRGEGTLALAGNNAYSGGTIISRGTVLARSDNALGTVGVVTLGDAATGTDPVTLLVDAIGSGGNRTVARDITVSSAGSGPVIIGTTAQPVTPGALNVNLNGSITLTNHDLFLRTGAGDFTRFNGDIAGTGNLIITNGSLNGDMRGNSGNRLILEGVAKTFTGDITIAAGSIVSPLLTNFTVLQINTANMLRDTINVTVQSNAVLRVNADEIINGLGGDGRVRGVVALRTLGVGAANASSILNGPLENDPFDGGSLALTKYGSGMLTLNGTNTHTGNTLIGGGTLALGANASLSNSPSLVLSNGTTLDASAIAGGFNLMGNQSLVSGGTVTGGLTAAMNATLTPGHTNVVGTLAVGGDLALNGNRLNFELDGVPAGPGNDQIAVTGDLSLSGLSTITVTPISPLTVGTYRLISYGGTKTAGGLANLALVMSGTRFTAALADNPGGIDLVVSAGAGGNLVWAANFTNSLWDVNTTTNWLNAGALDRYFQGDIVAFDSTAQQSNVTLNVVVTPASVAVSGATNYVLGGSGRISGTGSYTKSGTGTNLVSTANDYTGLTTISGGMLRMGASAALGSPVSGTIINSGATLDLNARTGVFEPVTVSGAGVLANGVPMGAIVNYGAATANDGLRGPVILAGDTTIGGANRWDMFGGTLLGNNFKLTKTNGIEISLANLGETGLGDIDIQQGLLTFLGTSTMGNPAKTVFVYPGATLHFWALNNPLTPLGKNVILTNSTIQSGSGNNFFVGTIQSVTNAIFNPAGGNIYFTGTVSGDNVTKNGGNIMGLYGVHTHTGSNLINAGVLSINSLANGGLPSGLGQSIADPTNLTFNGGTLQYVGPSVTTDRGFRLAGVGTIDLTNDVEFSGGFYGAGAFNKTGPGRLALSANTTNGSGQFQVRQGTVVLGNTIQSNTFSAELWAGHGGSPGATVVMNGGTNTVASWITIARDANTGDSMLFVNGSRLTSGNLSMGFQGGVPAGLASLVLSNGAFYQNNSSGNTFHGGEVANSRGQLVVDASSTFRTLGAAEIGQNGSFTGIFSGTVDLGVLQVALNNNSTGVVHQSAGTVTQLNAADARIGGYNAGANSLGIYTLSGGTLNLGGNNFQIGANGQGYLNQSGGVASSGGFLTVGRFAGSVGVLNVTGGQFNQTGAGTRLIVGEAGTGTMTVGGSGLIDCAGGLHVGHASGGNGTVNLLSGGVIATPLVERSGGSGTFHFDGGTLRAKANNATFFQGLSAARVQSGGAVLDSATFNVSINQSLLGGAGAGGLTKINPGTVTLVAPNTYTGPTFISGGTLALGSAAAISASPLVAVAAGAVFDVTAQGIYVQPAGQTLAGNGSVAGGFLAAGTVAPGASIGTLTFDSPLTLAGGTIMEIDRGAVPNADLVVAPAITNGGILIVTNLGGALMELDTFNLFDAASFDGVFASIVLPPLTGGLAWDLSQLYVDGSIRVVVPPSIVTPPVAQTGECGSNVTFTVVAAGTAPLSYQWRSNAVNIAGANGASLTLNNLNLASSGSFDVVVANGGGSATSTAASLTVADTTAPSVTCPANIVAECTSSNGAVVTFTATVSDSCAGTLTPLCVPASGSTFALGTNLVTCTATDGSGNTNACTFTIAVIDTTPPSITTCATNRTLSADSACQMALPDLTTEIVATDICGPVVLTQSPAAGTLVTTGATLVTITATDPASNSVTCMATITVADTTPPVIACPANLLVQCDAEVPVANFAGGSATDNCDTAPAVTHIGDVATGSCPRTILRTYRATDAAGNTNDCAQTITVQDTMPPMLTCPAPLSVQCPADVPGANLLLVSASDNCAPAPVVTHVGDVSVGMNPTTITRTYRATDACGNTNDCAQIITVQDNMPPVITTCASPVTLIGDTNGSLTVPDKRGEVVASDNCGAFIITQVPAPGSMVSTGVHILTFTVIDSASNTSACTATLTVVEGAIPPFITQQPTNTTAECGGNAVFAVSVGGTLPFVYQWYFGTNAITDATNSTLVIPAVTDANEGGYSVIVTNDGGSITSSVVTLAVVDTTAPLITCPAPVTVQCDAGVPAADFAGGSVADACDAMPVVTHVSDVAGGSCPKIITRTYRATDASGHTNDCAQIITVHDTTPPVVTCVVPQTYEAGVVWSFTAPGATDNCAGMINVTAFSTATNHTCGLTFVATRVWQATDFCGNSGTCTQVVTVVDTTAPVIVCPVNVMVECDTNVPAANFAGGSVTDAGDASPVVTHVSDVSSGACPKTIVRTYRATDACGNTNDCAQVITVHDLTPPVLTCPAPVMVQCDADVPAANFLGGSVTDNCDPAPGIAFISDVAVGMCPKIITRTYRATDACGNTNDCAQVITVHDTTPPAVNCPLPFVAKTASTNGGLVNFTATASDNCTASPLVVCAPGSGSLFPIGTTSVSCVASDACGNTNTCGFTVTVYFADGTNVVVNSPVPDIPSLGLVSVLNVQSPIGVLTDVNVTLNISNGWNGDLFAWLVHDSGYAVLLNRVGKSMGNPLGYSDSGMNITLDDQATNDVHKYRFSLFGNHTTPLAGPLTNAWQPDGRATDPALVLDTDLRTELLASFNGLNPNGEWVLYVEDDESGDTSTLVNWGLELCGTLGVSPVITNAPQNLAIDCGSNAVFTVGATGTGPVGYHWARNGVPIPGANGPAYAIPGAVPTDSATYSVIVSNAFGSATASATLVVSDPNLPVIVTQPQSVTNNVGTTVTLTVAVTSCSALSYQWCFGTAALAGQTNATLVIPNIQLTDQGSYTVKVSNAVGSITSAVAVVTVNRPPVAQNNGGATLQGQSLMIQLEKLLANDSDADGDPLTVISVTASTNGGGVMLGGGKVTYLPLPAFAGADRFSYTISDGRGGFATADVEVLVISGSLPSLNQVVLIPTPNGFLVRFAGIPGYAYKIQRAAFVTGPWTTITMQTAPLHGIIEYEDINPPPGSGFYRTIAP